jgi:hypothetical protein
MKLYILCDKGLQFFEVVFCVLQLYVFWDDFESIFIQIAAMYLSFRSGKGFQLFEVLFCVLQLYVFYVDFESILENLYGS